MEKFIKCKTCGAEIAKNAKTCPSCGAKNKKANVFLIVIIALFLIGCIGAAGGSSNSDDPVKVGEIDTNQSNSSSADSKPLTFKVGEIAELNDVRVTLLDVSESNGKSFLEPTEGNVFVTLEFEIENGRSEEISVSSLLSFEAYFDGYTTNLDISAITSSDKTQLDGSIASGKKMKGIVGYQVPKDWKECEIHFVTNVWSSREVVFEYSK